MMASLSADYRYRQERDRESHPLQKTRNQQAEHQGMERNRRKGTKKRKERKEKKRKELADSGVA